MSRLAGERGVTLVEMLIVVVILGIVLTGLVNVLVSGSRAESDATARVTAQQNARTALDRLAYEVRCSSSASVTGGGSGVTLSMPTQCSHASGDVSWCVSGDTLRRYDAAGCTGSEVTLVDSVASPAPFALLAESGTLPRLRVDLTVDAGGGGSDADAYRLADTLTLRNAAPTP